ncbi:MAG: hypothetical protein A2408_02680 [Candidatus Yonathbacteria bacterium RIFOXYC1_FULL_52_10]|uniref:Metal-dependent hydrolase n=1 Tax=Candidatus Yonathbacteria bacterium RIFOXYD1_FULL_52_36 TaxID=1802730 RepID=A0A1G2SLH4_9BACT|nr:MAG: hypothetical protein A2408_02680 [Candidatus Yonathbacteria bacterium RIFOXYC1_FULL_52_10]OHA85907.1 MAG: hypothetical protein A2591_04200 [Candidatus Yonathbacteria bacterium RIFOXYD1_FULL_52_36]
MKVVTHSGDFHADEVLAVATLSLFYGRENLLIIRSRDPEVIAAADSAVDVGYVYDPARLRFDHHQEGGAGTHENGIPYSSFGLVWKEYGERLSGSVEAARVIEEKVAYPIDAADNAIEVFTQVRSDAFPYLFHNMVSALRPTWKESFEGIRTFDQGFFEALSIAEHILRREITIAAHLQEGLSHISAAYETSPDRRILLIDGDYPVDSVAHKYPEVLFVVKPDKQNTDIWKVRTVRENLHSFMNRKDLPAAWAGKTYDALREITGVTDAVYCHTKRFIATARSKEGALELAHIATEHP